MLMRDGFHQRFGRNAIFGMVHLQPLPGAPLFGGSIDAVIDGAMVDARALVAGRCDGLLFENFGDKPFQKHVGPETVAAMTRVIADVARAISIPYGVHMLRNDAHAALPVAAARGPAFIRSNIDSGAMPT